jgi:preprotein translocase subunit SecG
MMAILMVIQVFVAIALIGVVLIQRSEGGGLGIGNSQGMGAFMSGRGTANLLTRATAILAAIFLGLSLTMALMNRGTSTAGSGILSQPPSPPAPTVPTSPAAPTPKAPKAAPTSTGAPASRPPAAPATTQAPATSTQAPVRPASPAAGPASKTPASKTPASNAPTTPTGPPVPH